MPSRPWSKVAADMLQFKGSEYLLCVDYYSKFPESVRMSSTTSAQTITCFKYLFARHGIPTELFTDNGPQFFKLCIQEILNWVGLHSHNRKSQIPAIEGPGGEMCPDCQEPAQKS